MIVELRTFEVYIFVRFASLYRDITLSLFSFLQTHKYEHTDSGYMIPYMGTCYFNNANYIDTTTLKEYIRKQM